MFSEIILNELETPAICVDKQKLLRNIRLMQGLADSNQVALRPHIKTHKSVEIAQRQIDIGAIGITVATVDEALVFLKENFKSITIARPIITPSKWDRLLDGVTKDINPIRVIVDSEEGIRIAANSATRKKQKIGIFLKIDVGLNRCGLLPNDRQLRPLVEMIHTHSYLAFCGILSHSGHVYGSNSLEDARNIAENERLTMLDVRDYLRKGGFPVPEVSVGATPAVLAAKSFEGITEIRPGNYVFLDLLPVRVGVARLSAISLTVLATVISKNDDYFITDAGSKTLTSDTGVHGMIGNQGFGLAYPIKHFLDAKKQLIVSKVSEEHSMIARSDYDLSIGSKIRIIPVHSCPVANLAPEYVILNSGNFICWPVDAAGKSK